MKKSWLALISILLLLTILGCGGNKIRPGFENAPCWVLQGCSCLEGDSRICGVGSMGNTGNISMARTGSLNRARVEIARVLQVKVESMYEDYQGTLSDGDKDSDEQKATDVARVITDNVISGTVPIETWFGPDDTLYTLAELDVDLFKELLGSVDGVSDAVRRAITERAEAAFSRLDETLDK